MSPGNKSFEMQLVQIPTSASWFVCSIARYLFTMSSWGLLGSLSMRGMNGWVALCFPRTPSPAVTSPHQVPWLCPQVVCCQYLYCTMQYSYHMTQSMSAHGLIRGFGCTNFC